MQHATTPPAKNPCQLVLAHYQEDLQWVVEQNWDNVVVYTKGPEGPTLNVDFPQIPLPNVGREAHTYLHHIVANYDDLADITIFSQAGIADHAGDNVRLSSLASQAADAREHGMTGFSRKHRFRDWDGVVYRFKWAEEVKSGTLGRASLTPGKFYEWVFGCPPPPTIPFYYGAIIGVHRHAILARPRSFYERLLAHFVGLGHANPEENHYMERFWVAVFDPDWEKRPASDSDLALDFR